MSVKSSIKSQKSLNDECSEIFERSYTHSHSMKTGSDSSSGEDEDENLAKELMHKMTPAVLSKLRRCFKKCKDKPRVSDIDSKVEEVMRAAAAEEGIEFAMTTTPPDPLSLDENGFIMAINQIFGHHKFTTHAKKLFRVLDPYNAGRAKWRQLVARLEAVGAKKTGSKKDRWNRVTCNSIEKLEHCKRETIIKIVNIEREDSFCYVAVSKGGRVGIYSGYMKLLHTYEVFYHRTGLRRRVTNCWITDAIYLSDVQYLVLSASDRSLTLYDATTLSHTPLFCITGLRNIPTCLAYSPCSDGSTSELAIGSERGDITRLTFLQPRVQLFHSKASDTINYYFWMNKSVSAAGVAGPSTRTRKHNEDELSSPPHSSNHVITTWRRVHSRSIRRLAYAREGEILLSCSHDSAVSVRARHIPGKLDDYVFKLQRGVSCFHAVYPLHLLATGSADGGVRLWGTSQATPFATLNAPSAPAVLDVAIIPAREVVVAFCNNCDGEALGLKLTRFQGSKIRPKVEAHNTRNPQQSPMYKTIEEENEPPPSSSRRNSSVFQAPSGGLILQEDPWHDPGPYKQPLYARFNRSSLLVTCCAHVCVLWLAPPRGAPRPPPGDTLPPRRPSAWDLPLLAETRTSPVLSPQPTPRVPSPKYLAPTAAEYPVQDLNTLLENAGLQGILERDFVLMKGLKHDLNRKLAEMEDSKDVMRAAVSAGAPYLSLKMYQPSTISPVDEMNDEYKRIMRLFPGSSVAATPAGSEISTPRNNRNQPL